MAGVDLRGLPRQRADPLGGRAPAHPHRRGRRLAVAPEPDLAGQISHARRIVDFRNQLAHDYAAVNDAVVWAITADQVPALRQECERILAARVAGGEAD